MAFLTNRNTNCNSYKFQVLESLVAGRKGRNGKGSLESWLGVSEWAAGQRAGCLSLELIWLKSVQTDVIIKCSHCSLLKSLREPGESMQKHLRG